MARWMVLVILGVSMLAASGCNTIEGFGKDVEAVGEALQDAAE